MAERSQPFKLSVRSGESEDASIARVLSEPEMRSAAVINRLDGIDLACLQEELKTQTAAIKSGDMLRAEAFLVAQAHTLDAIFANLVVRSHGNMVSGYGEMADRYMRLALKAQAQSVRTIEALAKLKNPMHIAFVGQANISNGPQQINNGVVASTDPTKILQNELSEVQYELHQNIGTSGHKGRIDSQMEALGEIHRPDY